MSIYKWSYLAKSKAPLLGKVLLTTNHLPDLYITTSNNQNNNKPLIVLVWTLWSSGFLKFSEWLTKSQWYHEMSTFMSLYNVQKQHNLALENVRKNSTHLSKSSSPVPQSFGQLWVIQSPFRLKRVRLGTKISTDGWSSYEHFQDLDCVVFAHCMMT